MATAIGRSTVLGIVANVVQVVTRLVTVPVVIAAMGLGGYGVWNVVMMTAGYMRFGSVGIKAAFQKYVAEATGDEAYTRASTLLSTGCAFMLVFSIAALIPAALFSDRIARWVGVPPEFLGSASGAISVLAVIMMLANTGSAFEAIVMGAHRIDLVRKANVVMAVLEAVAIVTAVKHGMGLFEMALIMGLSEAAYIAFCFVMAGRVLPEVKVARRFISRKVGFELFRFAGSYQLVNILEIVYVSMVPIAVLRAFGATSAGAYGVVTRVVTSAAIIQESFLAPILSSGSMVFATGSREAMHGLVTKAFRVIIGLSLFPMGLIAVFGPTMAYAWTGQPDPTFAVAFWLVSATAVFNGISLVALVLYRTTGSTVLDNVRQVVRIVIVAGIAGYAPVFGLYGVLAGFALAECTGMLFMIYGLGKAVHSFRPLQLLPEFGRLAAGAALTIGAAYLASLMPLPRFLHGRLMAGAQLAVIGLAAAATAGPALLATGAMTRAEGRAVLHSVFPPLLRVGRGRR